MRKAIVLAAVLSGAAVHASHARPFSFGVPGFAEDASADTSC